MNIMPWLWQGKETVPLTHVRDITPQLSAEKIEVDGGTSLMAYDATKMDGAIQGYI